MENQKILVVDDEIMMAKPLKLLLERAGYEVEVASDGKNGLALAVSWKPDLVILDIMLPDISGWEVCEKLRGNPDTHAIKVLMLTCYDAEDGLERSKERNADWLIIKPYNNNYMLTIIEKLLSQPNEQ